MTQQIRIHPDREAASTAANEFLDRVSDLAERLGIARTVVILEINAAAPEPDGEPSRLFSMASAGADDAQVALLIARAHGASRERLENAFGLQIAQGRRDARRE